MLDPKHIDIESALAGDWKAVYTCELGLKLEYQLAEGARIILDFEREYMSIVTPIVNNLNCVSMVFSQSWRVKGPIDFIQLHPHLLEIKRRFSIINIEKGTYGSDTAFRRERHQRIKLFRVARFELREMPFLEPEGLKNPEFL